MNKPAVLRFLITAAVVVVAVLLGRLLWQHYLYAPWTRDARVLAEVVHIAPDVSGLVTDVAVIDNQHVRKDQLLFRIDAARYRYAVDSAQADLASAKARARAAGANISAALASAAARRAEYDQRNLQARRREQLGNLISNEARTDAAASATAARASWRQAQAGGHQASAGREEAIAAVEQAQVALDQARFDLARTQVRAPTDGYVTNLKVRVGDYASAGDPQLALIDSHSYFIYGYFEETKLPQLRVGDPVNIRLMAGGLHLTGHITGIAHGITDRDDPSGKGLLADVSPTFNWVRLAQRVPVRIAIDTAHLPEGTFLAAGMTATIEVTPHVSATPSAKAQRAPER